MSNDDTLLWMGLAAVAAVALGLVSSAAGAVGASSSTGSWMSSSVDSRSYLPDTSRDGQGPSGGVISDPGTSRNFGRGGEQANDDLSERAANSNLDNEMKAAFDRLANRDEF